MWLESDETPTLTAPSRSGRNPDSSPRRPPGAGLRRGARLGRYVILQALGSGGSGCVYAAHDPELDRPVALKLLADTAPEARHQLLREARAAARLRHPNVVTVYDVGVVDGRPYLAMEQVRGRPLNRWLEETERSLEEILDVFHQAAQGLDAAHQAGLVHQDFKPGNVMVDEDGRAVVVDFGLARPTSGTSESPDPWPCGGTPPYAAPEQRRGEAADARSDQYALCAALATTLRMEPAPDGLPPPPRSAPVMPRQLQRAVARGLDTSPARRHGDLKPFLAALETRTSWNPLRRLRRRYVAAAVVILGFALGAAAAWQATLPRLVQHAQELERRLGTVWNPTRMERIRQAFEASGHDDSQDAFERTRQRLSEHTDAWRRELESFSSASATHPMEDPRPESTLRCLDGMLPRFDAILHMLETADRRTVEHSVRLVLDLEDPKACGRHPEGLVPPQPPPSRPELEIPVRDLRRRLAFVEIAECTRSYEQVLPLAEETVEDAAALDWAPVHAEALFWWARSLVRLHRCEAAEPILHRALREAVRGDHGQMAALSYSYLARCALDAHELAAARDGLRRAEPWLRTLPRHNEAASTYHSFRAQLARAEARPREAIEHFDKSLELDPTPTPLERGDVLNAIGIAWIDLGSYEEARKALSSSLEAYRAFYGEEGHFSMVPTLANLAVVERRQQRFDLALLYYERAQDILEASRDVDEHLFAYTHTGIGMTLLELGRPEEALEPLEKAVDAYERIVARSDRGGRSQLALARALWQTGRDRDRALELARRAEDSFRRAGPVWAAEAETARAWLAQRRDAS